MEKAGRAIGGGSSTAQPSRGLTLEAKIACTFATFVALVIAVQSSIEGGSAYGGVTLPLVAFAIGQLASVWFYHLDRSATLFIILAFAAGFGASYLDLYDQHMSALGATLLLGTATFLQPVLGPRIDRVFKTIDEKYRQRVHAGRLPWGRVLLLGELAALMLLIPSCT